MPRFLVEVKYTLDGIRGLKDQGGTARVAAAKALIEDLGGTLVSFDFAFGGSDAYLIADMPDHVAAAATGLIVSAAGGVTTRTTVLISPAEMDDAAKKQTSYRAPGS
ncbi:MAG TPA: GYD domain-containing protein [Acidimicrobiales bacterium]|jgi:uncharacterized protein with GYD domain|nr:GYD domain-containing protein [Acidimicrobiales bacterium]